MSTINERSTNLLALGRPGDFLQPEDIKHPIMQEICAERKNMSLKQRAIKLENEKETLLDKIKKNDALSSSSSPKGQPEANDRVEIPLPGAMDESERSQNLQVLLLILKGLMLARDAKLSMRRMEQELSVENQRNQINEMEKGMGWMIASAVLTGIVGVVSVAAGARGLFKNIQASREISRLQLDSNRINTPEAHFSRDANGKETLEMVRAPGAKTLIEANKVKIDQLKADIQSRIAFLQTLNGITQTVGATGNAITTAGKAQVDISVKQEELMALLARNQKDMTQLTVDQLDQMIQQLLRTIAENLQSSTQGFKAAANV
ncbi:type III secretion system translocon subunit SctB [Pseudomonas sp. MWU13-3659]|uniref:type III secretion system translocon subunit SctB n=1 Tax=Pseudomonas sp. MWU13-3659 TaxID=2986964 RepID=UPI00207570F9|nr:type III secretion system translocon subunit SctB [Pseudomonas sp. MWU13-3659]